MSGGDGMAFGDWAYQTRRQRITRRVRQWLRLPQS
jgi:hypothetical protein